MRQCRGRNSALRTMTSAWIWKELQGDSGRWKIWGTMAEGVVVGGAEGVLTERLAGVSCQEMKEGGRPVCGWWCVVALWPASMLLGKEGLVA